MTSEPVQALLPGRRALLVRLTCERGKRPAMLEMLNTYVDGLAEEPGTEVMVVSLDPDDETIVWLYEMFKDEDAENAHRASDGFIQMMQTMPSVLGAQPAILRMEPLRMAMQENMLVEDWSL
jgi:quinol monooxygenase YgiN